MAPFGIFTASGVDTPLDQFILLSAYKLDGDADFLFQHDLPFAYTVLQSVSKVASVTMVLLCFIGHQTGLTWTSVNPQQNHSLINSLPCQSVAEINAKVGPTKYRVNRN